MHREIDLSDSFQIGLSVSERLLKKSTMSHDANTLTPPPSAPDKGSQSEIPVLPHIADGGDGLIEGFPGAFHAMAEGVGRIAGNRAGERNRVGHGQS